MKRLAILALALGCVGQIDRPDPRRAPDPHAPDASAATMTSHPITGHDRCTLFATTAEVEAKLVMPRCGGTGTACHAGGPFSPRLAGPGKIAMAVVDQTAQLFCTDARYVDRKDVARSLILAKANPGAPMVTCPDGSNGGARMPYQQTPLNQDEYDCLTWWVHQLIAAPAASPDAGADPDAREEAHDARADRHDGGRRDR